jgi:hypothetical protein
MTQNNEPSFTTNTAHSDSTQLFEKNYRIRDCHYKVADSAKKWLKNSKVEIILDVLLS